MCLSCSFNREKQTNKKQLRNRFWGHEIQTIKIMEFWLVLCSVNNMTSPFLAVTELCLFFHVCSCSWLSCAQKVWATAGSASQSSSLDTGSNAWIPAEEKIRPVQARRSGECRENPERWVCLCQMSGRTSEKLFIFQTKLREIAFSRTLSCVMAGQKTLDLLRMIRTFKDK